MGKISKKISKETIPSFKRAPVAEEVFIKEVKDQFNVLPGYARYFVRQFIKNGNLKLAAQQAGLRVNGDELDSARFVDATDALNHYGLGLEKLMTYLLDCVEAKTVLRDKHGNMIDTVDLRVRLKALELIFKLRGDFDNITKKPGNDEDLFKDVSI